ncbi:hypothetical protein D3C72_1610240 [compost metagenome]
MMLWPVSQSHWPGAIRNDARFCSSLMRPTRAIGLVLMLRAPGSSPGFRRLLMPSVGISPGPTAFRRMPWRAHSTASDLVMTSMPALLIAEGTT